MFPHLFTIGPITLYSYGLMAAIGFLAGISWAAHLAKKEEIDPQKVFDTGFWVVVGAIVGSRIFYVGQHYESYLKDPLGVFKLWEGGLVFYGGVIGAVTATWLCVKAYKLAFWPLADILTPGVALGHAFGRIGCFLAGCCYGLETDVAWGVTFSDAASIAPTGVALHPTQLYSAANEFTLFLLLTVIRPYRTFYGQIWLTWLGLYAVTRSVIELFRGDPRGFILDGAITTSQVVAALMVTVAIYYYVKAHKTNRIP
jgi:phosphatidylglycerol:prolipoprotein diacylglycerol transferase